MPRASALILLALSPAIDFSFDFQDLRFTPVPAGEAREQTKD
jgi:hypothetical protein